MRGFFRGPLEGTMWVHVLCAITAFSPSEFTISSTTSHLNSRLHSETPVYTVIKRSGFSHRKPVHETRKRASLGCVQRKQVRLER
jgi:hypothetical protein